MLQTKQLSYAYVKAQAMRFPDIDIPSGEHWLLLGQSGSGKTTLLHLLGGLLTAKNGEVHIGDTNLSSLRGAALDRFRGQNIGIVFQKSHFVRSLNVQENLALAQNLAGLPTDNARISELLERLNLGHKLKSRTDQLSIGEQQRAAIARALVNQPKLILADEPTSALDDQNAREVAALLEEQAKAAGATLLVVTHDNRLQSHFSNQIHL
jgi:ABC-type lipoprotein export system ATPase subunit